jgi:hypothetical protein
MARSERVLLSESALLSELRKDARRLSEGGGSPEGDSEAVSVEFTAPAIKAREHRPVAEKEASSPEGRGARARATRGAECVSCRVLLKPFTVSGPVKNFGRPPIARV